jgi:uncharacterized protein (DUF433 family)
MRHERITVNPAVMVGKPVIKGTRILVHFILSKLGAGMTIAEIIADYPRLTPEDIFAAAAYAADVIGNEDIFLATPSRQISSDKVTT